LPKLNVGMDLMMCGRWVGERFTCGAGWFVQLALSLSALPSKTNEFHKRLSSEEGWSTSRGSPSTVLRTAASLQMPSRHPSQGSWIIEG
jgi:hypothetical protein